MKWLLALALVGSPLAAQEHHGHDGHHVASAQEIADNKDYAAVMEQVMARPNGPQSSAMWIDLRDAAVARKAGNRTGFTNALKAARQKLAAPIVGQTPIPVDMALSRAKTRYFETLRKTRIRLDPSPSDKRPFRKYKATAATTAALKVKTGTPAQIAKAVADLDTATAVLNELMRNPRP